MTFWGKGGGSPLWRVGVRKGNTWRRSPKAASLTAVWNVKIGLLKHAPLTHNIHVRGVRLCAVTLWSTQTFDRNTQTMRRAVPVGMSPRVTTVTLEIKGGFLCSFPTVKQFLFVSQSCLWWLQSLQADEKVLRGLLSEDLPPVRVCWEIQAVTSSFMMPAVSRACSMQTELAGQKI